MHRQRTPQLIGREDALRQLFDALERVSPARGALVLVRGEAGIGKTRLLEEFAARAADARVARGGCVDDVAYAPWTELLWWLLEGPGGAVVDQLPRGAVAQLGRLIPSLAIAEPEPEPADGGQHLLFEAVIELLRLVAERERLVLFVDDLHWIDPAGRELLRHVAANLRRVPLLLVVAYRGEDSASERELLAHLGRLGDDRIALEALPNDTTAEIATILLGADGSAADVDRIARDADGNPLFVEELVAAAETKRMPETLRDLMLARFSSLDDEARHVVRVAAVIGAHTPRAWLAGASGLSADAARAATRAAANSGVLVAEEGAYAFRHELLRQAVLDEQLPDETVELHRIVAQTLTDHAEYAFGVDRTAELGRHWDAAEVADQALKWLVATAQHAQESYAFENAYRAYERALIWWDAVADAAEVAGLDHAALLLEAADAAGLAGYIERAADLARAGLDESFALDLNRGVDAANRAYPLLWGAGRALELFEFATANVRPVLDQVDPVARARFLVTHTEHLVTYASPAQLRGPATEMLAALDQIEDPALAARAHIVSAWCYEAFGEYDRADAEYQAAEAVAREGRAHSMLALVLANHASSKISIPDLDACLSLLDAVDDLVERYGLRRYLVFAKYLRAFALSLLGDLGGAADALEPVANLPLEGSDAWQLAFGQAIVKLAAGDHHDALAAVEPESVGTEVLDETELQVQIASVRVDALAWLGEIETARRTVNEIRDVVSEHVEVFCYGWFVIAALRSEADAAVAASENGALDALETAQSRGDAVRAGWLRTIGGLEHSTPMVEAHSSAVDAEWARVVNEGADAKARFAAEAFEAISMPYYATYFRWREAEALLREGRRPTATELLKRARAVASAHGFAALEQAITNLARANQLRLGPARTTVDGDDALSVRELEVLRLLVDGRSNPEIAEALYISRRTAAAHVSNILRKMDASSRVEAVSEAHRRGVV